MLFELLVAEVCKLTYNEQLKFKQEIEEIISTRATIAADLAGSLIKPGDEVEICPDYSYKDEDRCTGIVEEIIGNKVYVPGINTSMYGDTPYIRAISKITRKGELVFDRNIA